MHGKYLGDSYDIVKRFWATSLEPIGKLYAYHQFVPSKLQNEYERMTEIKVLEKESSPGGEFGLLLDPHTGIPLPSSAMEKPSASHVPLSFIVGLNKSLRPKYMICFDQTYHRRHELTTQEQLESKRKYLAKNGIESFYYDSHAPFLFMADVHGVLEVVKKRLMDLGVPERRFELRAKRKEKKPAPVTDQS